MAKNVTRNRKKNHLSEDGDGEDQPQEDAGDRKKEKRKHTPSPPPPSPPSPSLLHRPLLRHLPGFMKQRRVKEKEMKKKKNGGCGNHTRTTMTVSSMSSKIFALWGIVLTSPSERASSDANLTDDLYNQTLHLAF
ncbi:uncharacterized protein LOC107305472 isoform X2 [Oryza brachyantha]|nr:uncharacterized protein LOC107305472 isoform X2 [Oryza brachyantha]